MDPLDDGLDELGEPILGNWNGASGDPDKDGYSNFDEFWRDWDPWVSNRVSSTAPAIEDDQPPDVSAMTVRLTWAGGLASDAPAIGSTLQAVATGAYDSPLMTVGYVYQWYHAVAGAGDRELALADANFATPVGDGFPATLDGNWVAIENAEGPAYNPADNGESDPRDYFVAVYAVDDFGNRAELVGAANVLTTASGLSVPENVEAAAIRIVQRVAARDGWLLEVDFAEDPTLTYRYEWWRNFGERTGERLGLTGRRLDLKDSTVIQAIADSLGMSPLREDLAEAVAEAIRGDVWYVTVTAIDPETKLESDPVRSVGWVSAKDDGFADSAPTVPSVRLEPSSPRSGIDDLRVVVQRAALDPEGEAVSYQYHWFSIDEHSFERVPIVDSTTDIPFSGSVLPAAMTREEAGTLVQAQILAVDPSGNYSTAWTTVVVVSEESASSSGLIVADAFEPDGEPALAHLLLVNDTDPEVHTLHYGESDWMWFDLDIESDVWIRTGNLGRFDGSGGGQVDTRMWLHQDGQFIRPIAYSDDVGVRGTASFSTEAEICETLAPGRYHVRVGAYNPFADVYTRYGIHVSSQPVSSTPATPSKPEIASYVSYLRTEIEAKSASIGNGLTLHYQWYADSLKVPNSDYQRLPARFLQDARSWQVAVYAEDSSGRRSPMSPLSEPVTIPDAGWLTEVRAVSSIEQKRVIDKVVIGCQPRLGAGYDDWNPKRSVIDVELLRIDGGIVDDGIPAGSFYSEGLEDGYPALQTDVRSTGIVANWYLHLNLEPGVARARLEWAEMNPALPMTIVEVDPENGFQPRPGARTVNMAAESRYEIDVQPGTFRKVFHVRFGAKKIGYSLRLYPGWNLISLPNDPFISDPTVVFANENGDRLYRDFLELSPASFFGRPTYREPTMVKGGVGYWINTNFETDETPIDPVTGLPQGYRDISVLGVAADRNWELHKGWNLVGVPWLGGSQTTDVPAQLVLEANKPAYLYLNAADPAANLAEGGYEPAGGPLHPKLEIGRGYLIYSPRQQTVPVW